MKKVPLAPQGPAKNKVEYNDTEPLSVVVDNWTWGVEHNHVKEWGFVKVGEVCFNCTSVP